MKDGDDGCTCGSSRIYALISANGDAWDWECKNCFERHGGEGYYVLLRSKPGRRLPYQTYTLPCQLFDQFVSLQSLPLPPLGGVGGDRGRNHSELRRKTLLSKGQSTDELSRLLQDYYKFTSHRLGSTKYTPQKQPYILPNWRIRVRRLLEDCSITFDRFASVCRWYLKHADDPYTPECPTMIGFCEDFFRVEKAKHRHEIGKDQPLPPGHFSMEEEEGDGLTSDGKYLYKNGKRIDSID